MLWGPSAHSMTQSELGSILQCLAAPEDFENLLQHVAAALDARRPGSARSSASKSSVRTHMTTKTAVQCLGWYILPQLFQFFPGVPPPVKHECGFERYTLV